MRSALNNMSADDMEDDKVMCKLATEATDLNLDEVGKTLHQIKPGDKIEQSLAKVGKMKQSELAKCGPNKKSPCMIYGFMYQKKE